MCQALSPELSGPHPLRSPQLLQLCQASSEGVCKDPALAASLQLDKQAAFPREPRGVRQRGQKSPPIFQVREPGGPLNCRKHIEVEEHLLLPDHTQSSGGWGTGGGGARIQEERN